MNSTEREKFIWRQLLGSDTNQAAVKRILEMWENQLDEALGADMKQIYQTGYDQAAHDITLAIQNCIPGECRTIEEARVKGAWTDAANISLNHLGKSQ